jgi:hypothetical protein
MKTTLTIVTLALWMGCTTCLAQTPGLPPSAGETARQFDDAIEAYEHCHWLQSFNALASLADRGHAEAARIVMQMQRFGPALYGQRFAMTPEQGERWAAARTRQLGDRAAR